MKASEFRNKTDGELQNELDDAYQEMFNLRFQKTSGQLANTARVSEVRKNVARIKMVMRERELAVAE